MTYLRLLLLLPLFSREEKAVEGYSTVYSMYQAATSVVALGPREHLRERGREFWRRIWLQRKEIEVVIQKKKEKEFIKNKQRKTGTKERIDLNVNSQLPKDLHHLLTRGKLQHLNRKLFDVWRDEIKRNRFRPILIHRSIHPSTPPSACINCNWSFSKWNRNPPKEDDSSTRGRRSSKC